MWSPNESPQPLSPHPPTFSSEIPGTSFVSDKTAWIGFAWGLLYVMVFTVLKLSCGKVMFSQVCVKNPVHTGEVHTPGQTPPPWEDTPYQADTPLARQTPPWADTLQDGYCSGWYASYWNAFLLNIFPLNARKTELVGATKSDV